MNEMKRNEMKSEIILMEKVSIKLYFDEERFSSSNKNIF